MQSSGTFGPFRPLARLARGGMGEVWKAEHPDLGLAVAVKTVPAAARGAFDGEIANVATLAHPHIVQVFDRGFTEGPWGELPPGTPWLAMELAETTLAHRPPATLAGLRAALLQVLDALGHAHGRGVLHLDVKPGNLLRDGDRVLLADFGISTLVRGRPATGWGTPGFAAPEQLEGRWRELGPWTDLYALGATAAALSGPDSGPALAAWIHRATRTHPAARFQSAAEAREVLLACEVEGPTGGRAVAVAPTAPAEALGEPAPPSRPAPFWPQRIPALPPPEPHRPQLAGAGAAVFGQRTVPLVARDAERRALWSALEGVLGARVPRWIWLTGPSGVGKSRLAEWLVTHAHAAAGVRVWRATHAGGQDGLRDAARDALAAQGLSGAALERHLEARVGPAPGLAAWLDGRPLPAAAAAAALASAIHEPAVWWIDDAHDADPELLAALAGSLRGAVLVVATARTDGVDEPTRAALAALPGDRLALGPLGAEALRAMLAGALGLDPTSAVAVAERAEGNALVAAHLVAGAIAAGELVPGRSGLRVDADALRLPTSVTGVWARRLAEIAGPDRDALELAAVLGTRFEPAWRRAVGSGAAGLATRALRAQVWEVEGGELRWTHEMAREATLAAADLPALHARAAAVVDPERDPGRAGRHHLGAGDVQRGAELLLRAVRTHAARGEWLAADRADRELARALDRLPAPGLAVDRLLERARMASSRWRSAEAWRVLESIRADVERDGTIDQRGLFHWLCGQTLLVDQRPREALAAFEQAEALHGADPARRTRLLRAQARCLRLTGDLAGALARLREAVRVAAGLGDRVAEADNHLTLAVTLHTAGRFDEALPAYLDAIGGYGDAHPGAAAQVWTNLGDLHRHRGDPAAARTAYARARPLVEATGMATDSLDLGEAVSWAEDAPDRARQALAALATRAAGPAQRSFVHVYSLALCDDPGAWDAHWAAAGPLLADLPADLDLAAGLERAARRAEAGGWADRAADARASAATVRRKLAP